MEAKENRKMVTGVFRDRVNADLAYQALLNRGYSDSEINVLMSDKTRSYYYTSGSADESHARAGSMATEGMGIGGAIGAAVGATLAAVAAAGTLVAIGPLGLVMSGPLAAGLAGGGAGAITGGLLGALVGYGIPESNAEAYEDALRHGGVVLGVVLHKDEDANEIEKDFRNHHGENVCTVDS